MGELSFFIGVMRLWKMLVLVVGMMIVLVVMMRFGGFNCYEDFGVLVVMMFELLILGVFVVS